MSENTTQLIEKLAEKMGTTSEYLWGILIKQAPISAVSEILLMVLLGIIVFLTVKAHFRFSREDERGYRVYDHNLGLESIMIAVSFILSICVIYSICTIPGIVTALVNPEYWALNKILNTLK